MSIYKRNPGEFHASSSYASPPPGRRPNRLTTPINSRIKHNSSKDDIDEDLSDDIFLNSINKIKRIMIAIMITSMILFILLVVFLSTPDSKNSPPSIEKQITEKVDTNNGSLKQL